MLAEAFAVSRVPFCVACKSSILQHTFRRFGLSSSTFQPISKKLLANVNSATNSTVKSIFGLSTLPFGRLKLTSSRLTRWFFLKLNQIRGISYGHVRQKNLTNIDRLHREKLLKGNKNGRWSKIWENIAESPFKMATPVVIGLGLLAVMKNADPKCFQARLKEMTVDEKAKLEMVLKAVGEGCLYSAAFTLLWCFIRTSRWSKGLNIMTEHYTVVPTVWVSYIISISALLGVSISYRYHRLNRLEEQKKGKIKIKDPEAEKERISNMASNVGNVVEFFVATTACFGGVIIGGLPRIFGEAKEILKRTGIPTRRVYFKLASFATLFVGVLAVPTTIAIILPDDCVLKHKFTIQAVGTISLCLGALPYIAREIGSHLSNVRNPWLLDMISTRRFFIFRSVAGLIFFSSFFMVLVQDTLHKIENSDNEPVDLVDSVTPVACLIGFLPFYVGLLYPMALGYKIASRVRGLLI